MRENRTHGSEGGESRKALLYPYQAQGGETSCYSGICGTAKLPSMALDTGIPAGMTTLKHTCV